MKVKGLTGFKNAVDKDKEFMHPHRLRRMPHRSFLWGVGQCCRTHDGHTHLAARPTCPAQGGCGGFAATVFGVVQV